MQRSRLGSFRPRAVALAAGACVALAAAAPATHAAVSTFSYDGPPVVIPDGLDLSGVAPGAVATIPIAVSRLGATLSDVDFRIDGDACTSMLGAPTVGIDHSFVSDLQISLTSPAGTSVPLIVQAGDRGKNLCQVVLDDDSAAPSIQTANLIQAPFTGTWAPNAPLSTFDGEDPNGTWTVSARDYLALDVGNLRAVSLLISAKVGPTLTGTASADTVLGASALSDMVEVTGRRDAHAGATLDFRLYGPDDATCTGPPVLTSTVPQPVADGPVTSASYVPTEPGTYRWVAAYGGDADNESAAGSCGDPGQVTTVDRAVPTVTGTSSDAVVLGGQVTDAATVTGLFGTPAAATVDFRLYGPDDATCANPPAFTSPNRPLGADGSATSAPFVPTAIGVYRWTVNYDGDPLNQAATSSCDATEQHVAVRAEERPEPPPASTATPKPPPTPSPEPTASGVPHNAVVPASTPPRTCTSRRRLTLHLIRRKGFRATMRGARITRVTLTGPKGKRIKQRSRKPHRSSKTKATVNLRGLPKGRYTVRITVRLRTGKHVRFVRHYVTCAGAKRR